MKRRFGESEKKSQVEREMGGGGGNRERGRERREERQTRGGREREREREKESTSASGKTVLWIAPLSFCGAESADRPGVAHIGARRGDGASGTELPCHRPLPQRTTAFKCT